MNEEYWETRYLNDGISGPGSRGSEKETRWNIIKRRIPEIEDVIDVGCGDLAFWEGVECKKYVGIDISQTVIDRNKQLRPGWGFFHNRAEDYIPDLKAETVFCLGVLFHIMNVAHFKDILRNLCRYTSRNLVILNADRNPFSRWGALLRRDLNHVLSPSITDFKYQYFRKIEDHLPLFEKFGLKLTYKERLDYFEAFYFFTTTEGLT